MITDMNTIRERVFRGDTVFSQRVLLTALIKCGDKIKSRILKQVDVEHFGQATFGHVFEWITQALQSRGEVDETELYQRMESYVRSHWVSASDPAYDGSQYSAEDVLPGYMAVIDHLLAIETPDVEVVDKAIAWLQRYNT